MNQLISRGFALLYVMGCFAFKWSVGIRFVAQGSPLLPRSVSSDCEACDDTSAALRYVEVKWNALKEDPDYGAKVGSIHAGCGPGSGIPQ